MVYDIFHSLVMVKAVHTQLEEASHHGAPEFERRQECVRQQREWEQIFEALYESTKVIC